VDPGSAGQGQAPEQSRTAFATGQKASGQENARHGLDQLRIWNSGKCAGGQIAEWGGI
jgi:hypothetical protein